MKNYKALNLNTPAYYNIQARSIESACEILVKRFDHDAYEYTMDSPSIGKIHIFNNGLKIASYCICEMH